MFFFHCGFKVFRDVQRLIRLKLYAGFCAANTSGLATPYRASKACPINSIPTSYTVRSSYFQ
jgi:hypothetical protein